MPPWPFLLPPTKLTTGVCKPIAQKQTQMADVEQTQHMFF